MALSTEKETYPDRLREGLLLLRRLGELLAANLADRVRLPLVDVRKFERRAGGLLLAPLALTTSLLQLFQL